MNESKEPVPYIAFESVIARFERQTKRLMVALFISLILLFFSNAIWLYAWSQYDYSSDMTSTETVDVNAKDGIANYIGNNGDINNGKDKSDQNGN